MAIQNSTMNTQQMWKQNKSPQENAQQQSLTKNGMRNVQQHTGEESLTQPSVRQTTEMNIFPQGNAKQNSVLYFNKVKEIDKIQTMRNLIGGSKNIKQYKDVPQKKVENTLKKIMGGKV